MTQKLYKIDRTDGGISIMRIIQEGAVIETEIEKWQATSGYECSGYAEITETEAASINAASQQSGQIENPDNNGITG